MKLTVYVRTVISFFYKPRSMWNSDISNIFGKIVNFGPQMFYCKLAILRFGHVCDIIVMSFDA